MDLQVKKMKVGISTTVGQKSLPSPYHHLQSRGKLLIHPQLRGMTMKTYFKMYCFKSNFLKHVTEKCTFCWKVLFVTLSKKPGSYSY